MKILHIAVHLGGGAGKAITGLAASQDTIVLLEKPQKSCWIKKALQKGARVVIEPDSDTMKYMIKEADAVVVNWWGHPLMVQFAAQLPEVPCRLVLYCHVNGCVYPYLPFAFLAAFDSVMFTTPYSYENPLWTETERGWVEENAAVVYGMGDFKPELYRPRDFYDSGDDFIIGYIGTLNYAKLHPDFLQYCESVCKKVKNAKFLLAGDMAEDVERDIRCSSIAERFVYAGYVNHTEDFYKQIDVLGYLLNGYNFATTENVLLETMAYATPIVVLNQGVERHIIEDGCNGYLANNAEEYAERIFHLYSSKEVRIKLGRAARRSCIERYSSERNRNAYRQVLKKCLQMDKSLHRTDVLNGKMPFEWLLLFAQKDKNTFEKEIEDVFVQESKGSVFQYAKYFHTDTELERLCRNLRRKVK